MTAAVFLLSAAILAHEVCLLRVLAIASWYHAASLVVSVALLAFGLSGTILALAPRLRRAGVAAACAALYALAIPLSLRAAAAVDLNLLEVGWAPSQWLRLLLLQAVFTVPFLFGALGIGIALALAAPRPGRLYAANLLGSCLGSVAAPALLHLGPPDLALAAISVAAALATLPLRPLLALAAAAAWLLRAPGLPMSPYKDLESAPQRRIVTTTYGPTSRIDVAEVPTLHYAPGLSLQSPAAPRGQAGIYADGHLAGALDRAPADYLQHTLGHLPFLLADAPRVLLLGVGPDLPRATLVADADPALSSAARRAGVVEEPRAFLESTPQRFDLILHHLPELHPASETPLLTVEGMRAALDRADVAAAFSCAWTNPPRAARKLLATAERVTPHLVAARSHDRLCVLLLHAPPDEDRKTRLIRFCREEGFDPLLPLSWRFDPPFHEDRATGTPYDLEPATDARPYFYKFFRWSRIRDLFHRDRIALVEWPYVALLAGFLQITLLSVLLLAGPLVLSRAARAPAAIFLALGLGYMLLEMAFFQRAMVRGASPVQAAVVVFGGFLFGSGLGSLRSERIPRRWAAVAVALAAPLAFLALPRSLAVAWAVCAALAFPMGVPFPRSLARLRPESVPWALAWNGCASVAASSLAPLLSTTISIAATMAGAAALYLCVALAPERG